MTAHLTGGFADHAVEAARAFRAAMEAMARPGTAVALPGARPPEPLSPAAGSLILTLCDTTTPLFLAPGHDSDDARQWIAFHTGAPAAARGEAVFALGTWSALLPLSDYAQGLEEYPDRSATLIVEGRGRVPARLTGPGIRAAARATLPEIAAFRANAMAFPLGLDFFFTEGETVTALPRTTRVEAA